MRDKLDYRFREDENELPYLVVEKRDAYTASKPKRQKQTLDGVINSLYISAHEKSIIHSKLAEFSHAKDVKGLRVEDGFDGISFNIIRENQYITTTHEFIYFPGRLDELGYFLTATQLMTTPGF